MSTRPSITVTVTLKLSATQKCSVWPKKTFELKLTFYQRPKKQRNFTNNIRKPWFPQIHRLINASAPFNHFQMEAIFPTNNLLAQALLGSTRSPRRNPLRPVQGNTLQKAKDLGLQKAFQSPSKHQSPSKQVCTLVYCHFRIFLIQDKNIRSELSRCERSTLRKDSGASDQRHRNRCRKSSSYLIRWHCCCCDAKCWHENRYILHSWLSFSSVCSLSRMQHSSAVLFAKLGNGWSRMLGFIQ